jgi:serine/threonine protein kinase
MWSRLKLTRKLGEGGMGEVWLAYHADLAAQFAVKKLKREFIRKKDFRRFEREARCLKELRHPNIVRVLDVSDDPTRPGYAMEYCPRGSLADHVSEYSGNVEKSLGAFWQIIDAVEYLHSLPSPIIHRDVKPENVLFGADGNLKLSDFGLSRSMDTERVTTSTVVSVGFSPPEQYDGLKVPDQRGDLYSAGATLYFLVVGQYYSSYTGLNDIDRPDLAHILTRLLKREVDERFQSVAELRRAWHVLKSSDASVADYLTLPIEDRKAKIAAFSGIYLGMDDDLGECHKASMFLDKVLPVEPDAALRETIKKSQKYIDVIFRQIAAEMEQDNPAY